MSHSCWRPQCFVIWYLGNLQGAISLATFSPLAAWQAPVPVSSPELLGRGFLPPSGSAAQFWPGATPASFAGPLSVPEAAHQAHFEAFSRLPATNGLVPSALAPAAFAPVPSSDWAASASLRQILCQPSIESGLTEQPQESGYSEPAKTQTLQMEAATKHEGDDDQEIQDFINANGLIIGLVVIIVSVVVGYCVATTFPIGSHALLYKEQDLDQSDKKDLDELVQIANGDEVKLRFFKRMLLDAKATIRMGWHSKMQGNILYMVSVVSAGTVPVLIANIGGFGEAIDRQMKICAVVLSMLGTLCHALSDTYQYRPRGHILINAGMQMMHLINEYATKTHSGHTTFCKDDLMMAHGISDDFQYEVEEKYKGDKQRRWNAEIDRLAFEDLVDEYNDLEVQIRAAMTMEHSGKPKSVVKKLGGRKKETKGGGGNEDNDDEEGKEDQQDPGQAAQADTAT